jgi:hypothetical protein
MHLLRQFWYWLTGRSTTPITLVMKLEDENGVSSLLRHPDRYEEMLEAGILSLEAHRDGKDISEDHALELAKWVYDGGFLSNATAAAYGVKAGGKLVRPGEVPPGETITKMNIRCLIPPHRANDLEA